MNGNRLLAPYLLHIKRLMKNFDGIKTEKPAAREKGIRQNHCERS